MIKEKFTKALALTMAAENPDVVLKVMKAAGIEAEMRKSKQKEYTEYVVRIPNKSA